MAGADPNPNFGYVFQPDLDAQYGGGQANQDLSKIYYTGNQPADKRLPLAKQATDWSNVQIEEMVQMVNARHDGHSRLTPSAPSGTRARWRQY